MKLNFLKITGNINFILIFPVYMFSQLFVQLGYISPYMWTSFSFLLALSIPISVIGLSGSKEIYLLLRISLVQAFFLFLFLYFGFALYQYLSTDSVDFFIYHLKSILRLLAFYLLVFNLFLGRSFEGKLNVYMILFFAVSLVFLSTGKFLSISALRIGDDYFELDYQMIAFLILFFLIGSLSFKSFLYRAIIFSLMAVSLFFLGARTEFYMALVFFLIVIFLESNNKISTILMLAGGALVFLLYFYFYFGVDGFKSIRIFAILFDGVDASRSSRSQLSENAIQTISNHPLVGDFGSHELGAYAHNLLSAWVDFGVLGFLYLLVLVLFPVGHVLINFNKSFGPIYISAFSSLSLLVMAFTLAKTYNYSMLAVALAYYALWLLKQDGLRYDR